MTAIDNQAGKALFLRENFSKNNTVVRAIEEGHELLLHGSCIAKNIKGKLSICNAGYATATTKARLNGCLEAFGHHTIYQKAAQWFFTDGQPWCGEWKTM